RAARKAQRLAARRRDHDPRPAERAHALVRVLSDHGLDGWLHRRVELRHGGDLAADRGRHSHRNPAITMRIARIGEPQLEASVEIPDLVDARVGPRGSLENLSQAEMAKLLDSSQGGLYPLFRKCALAVLNTGADTDNAKEIFDRYRDFE